MFLNSVEAARKRTILPIVKKLAGDILRVRRGRDCVFSSDFVEEVRRLGRCFVRDGYRVRSLLLYGVYQMEREGVWWGE